MASYAVLGATGNAGTAILEILSQRPENRIHAFARSASKLKSQQSQLYQSGQLQIFEGEISDTKVLARCLENTRAAFICIAAINNIPHCTLSQDTAKAVIAAMEQLRSEQQRLPRLVQLNSSCTDKKLSASLPKIAHTILYRGNWWIYEDLRASEALLRSHSSWVNVTFMMPGGLIHDAQKGHKLSTEKQKTFLGWLDLAAGMVEVADEESDAWVGRNVSVLPVAGEVPINWMVPWYMIVGLCLTYAPWSYGAFRSIGLV